MASRRKFLQGSVLATVASLLGFQDVVEPDKPVSCDQCVNTHEYFKEILHQPFTPDVETSIKKLLDPSQHSHNSGCVYGEIASQYGLDPEEIVNSYRHTRTELVGGTLNVDVVFDTGGDVDTVDTVLTVD